MFFCLQDNLKIKCLDAEENARRNPDKLLTDFGAFLKENYSVGEKQSSREQIIRDTNHNNWMDE